MGSVRPSSSQPFRHKVGVSEPAHRLNQRLDRLRHEIEVEMGDVVVGLVVGGGSAPSSYGMRNYSSNCEGVVVGTFEEVLFRIGIVAEQGSVLYQSGTKVGAVPSGDQQLSFGHFWVLIADHLELDVGCDVVDGDGRVLAEVRGTQASKLLASIADKVDRSLRSGTACECVCEFEDSDRAGGVVVRSVVDRVAVYRPCDSEMVEMGGEQNRLGVGAGIFAGKHGNGVVGVARSVLGVNFEGDDGVGRKFRQALACILGDGENAKAAAERASRVGKMRFDCAALAQAPG